MRTYIASAAGAAFLLALVGGCSKPATKTSADTTDAAADAGAGAANSAATTVAGAGDAGGAVSPPQSNGAINPAANTDNAALAPGSNSFTEDQARGHIEHAGYADVSALTKTEGGMWTGKAKKDGKTVNVSVDFKGAVSAN